MWRRRQKWAKGLAAGVVGGLIGTMVMTEFQKAWSGTAKEIQKKAHQNGAQTANAAQQHEQSTQTEHHEYKEDSTMRAAGKIAEWSGAEPLSHEEKKKLSPLVHYGFGTLQGAIYGTVTEMRGDGGGGWIPALLFGAALFVAADEIAVPALGFSKKPTESPLSAHLFGLASHIVYGVSTELARRGMRAAI